MHAQVLRHAGHNVPAHKRAPVHAHCILVVLQYSYTCTRVPVCAAKRYTTATLCPVSTVNLSNRDGMVALRDRVTSHETHNDTTVNCSARALKIKVLSLYV